MQACEEFCIKFICFDRLATHNHLQLIDRKDVNIRTKCNQLTSRPVSIATSFIENIYAFAALTQIRDKVKYAIFFALINLIF